jgi:YD repeat-containing protein
MYRHRVAVEAGPYYRVDSASGSNTPVSVFHPDGVTTVGNAFGTSGSTVRGNGERGTVEFTSATATLYLKRLTYKGAVAGDTPITSTGQDLTQPAQPDLADVIARLPGTYVPILTPATGLTYNADGTVATQTVAGVATSYTYNADGTVATEVRAGVTRTYTYNADGTLASVA